ncbi:MAG: hypothetical protein CML50_16500 [Rhodobacteraceae bacterium]|nr:hypothetical protein [Paracoccaceae bacterium]
MCSQIFYLLQFIIDNVFVFLFICKRFFYFLLFFFLFLFIIFVFFVTTKCFKLGIFWEKVIRFIWLYSTTTSIICKENNSDKSN